jgi:hypothetical protein
MVLYNVFWDHVGSFVLLVWISNQRQAEGKVDNFGSIYIFLVPRQKFTEESIKFRRIIKASLGKKPKLKSIVNRINRQVSLSPRESQYFCEGHHFRSLFRHAAAFDTNLCNPTAYHRHNSVPRSVTRLRANGIRLVIHRAEDKWGELVLLLIIYKF